MASLQRFIFAILVLIPAIMYVDAQTSTDADNLYQYLLNTTRYNKRVRPLSDQSHILQDGAIEVFGSEMVLLTNYKYSDRVDEMTEKLETNDTVQLTFSLVSIIEFNEIEQYIKILGYHTVVWTDEFLAWIPASYGGLSAVPLEQRDIWEPYLELSYPGDKPQKVGDGGYAIRVDSNGSIYLSATGTYESLCTVDITWFPVDTQICKLQWTLLKYRPNEVMLTTLSTDETLRNYERNAQWDIQGISEYIELKGDGSYQVPLYTFQISLRRRPAFFVLHSLIPVFFLSVLNAFVFILPVESGERISFSITIFLALAIFITMLSTELPRNSVNVSIYSVYLNIYTFFSPLFVVVTVFNLRVFHKKDTGPISPFYRKLVRLTERFPCVRRTRVSDENRWEKEQKDNYSENKGDNQYSKDDKEQNITIHGEHGYQDKITWIDVSVALDKLFFVIFVVLLFLICLIMFAILFSH